MITVESFVDPSIIGNPPILLNPKILFITENCPDFRTYIYRTLPTNPYPIAKANNLLNNLCVATGIIGTTEIDKLNIFLNHRNYAVLDTYQNGTVWGLHPPHHPIADICADIIYLNPEQIIFTTIRSNSGLFPHIYAGLPTHLQTRIVYRIDTGSAIFNSPSDRAFLGFLNQINDVVAAGTLIL